MAQSVNAYSFLDINAAIKGPGGSFNIGSDAGVAEEGITVSYDSDIGTLVWGADGVPMHSLHAAHGGRVTIRLLKTSPVNAQLSQMYLVQTTTSSLYAQNTITVRNPARGDTVVCTQCAFRKMPDNVNGKEGGTNEWVFNAGVIDTILGNGVPASGV